MALTASEKNEIEVIVRKEIKNFMGNNTMKQFEDKLMDRIQKDIKRGKLEGDIKDIVVKSFREFFTMMFHHRSFWESKFRSS